MGRRRFLEQMVEDAMQEGVTGIHSAADVVINLEEDAEVESLVQEGMHPRA